jgi:hypothetical protein
VVTKAAHHRWTYTGPALKNGYKYKEEKWSLLSFLLKENISQKM